MRIDYVTYKINSNTVMNTAKGICRNEALYIVRNYGSVRNIENMGSMRYV